MNLLGILLKLMLAKKSIDSVAGKTGLSDKQIKKLLTLALPLLMKYLTSNASQGNGALSLLGALSQHTNKDSVDLQLRQADEKDGSRIIGHILGGDEDKVTRDLAAQTGIDPLMVAKVLAIIAPFLLSGISAAQNQQAQAQAQPLQVLQPQAAPAPSLGGAGLLGSLFGLPAQEEKEEELPVLNLGSQAAGADGSALLNLLLGAMK